MGALKKQYIQIQHKRAVEDVEKERKTTLHKILNESYAKRDLCVRVADERAMFYYHPPEQFPQREFNRIMINEKTTQGAFLKKWRAANEAKGSPPLTTLVVRSFIKYLTELLAEKYEIPSDRYNALNLYL